MTTTCQPVQGIVQGQSTGFDVPCVVVRRRGGLYVYVCVFVCLCMCMRYPWIRDSGSLREFIVRWICGHDNIANFLTKPQPAYADILYS